MVRFLRVAWVVLTTVSVAAANPPSTRAEFQRDKVSRASPVQHADKAYIDGLVSQARLQGLADQEMWRRLLHYRRTLFGGWRSEADAKSFFASPDGKT